MREFDKAYSRLMEVNKLLMEWDGVELPTLKRYAMTGTDYAYEWRLKNGKLHRIDGPAREVCKKDGRILWRAWLIDGLGKHRLDGPAEESFYNNGKLQERDWWLKNNRHRVDGPAIEQFYEDGGPKSRYWYASGKKHRVDGPAVEFFNKDGGLESRFWYVSDKQYTEEEFNKEYDPSTSIEKRRLKSDLSDIF